MDYATKLSLRGIETLDDATDAVTGYCEVQGWPKVRVERWRDFSGTGVRQMVATIYAASGAGIGCPLGDARLTFEGGRVCKGAGLLDRKQRITITDITVSERI